MFKVKKRTISGYLTHTSGNAATIYKRTTIYKHNTHLCEFFSVKNQNEIYYTFW